MNESKISKGPILPNEEDNALKFNNGSSIGPAPDVNEGEITPNQYANLTKSSKLNKFLNLLGGNVNPKSTPVFYQTEASIRAQLEGVYTDRGTIEPEYGDYPYVASGLGPDVNDGEEKQAPEHEAASPVALDTLKKVPVTQIDKVFKEYGLSRSNLQGYEMTSQSRWGITIEPYKSTTANRSSMLPDLPTYTSKLGTVDLSKPAVLNWSLQYGNFGSEEMNLYGGRGMSVTSEFMPNMNLTMSVLDDYYMSWSKYFRQLAVMMTSANKTTPAHPVWWSLLWKISIRVFTPQYGINLASELIASLNSVPFNNESGDDSNEYSHAIDFNIVGDMYSNIKDSMNQSSATKLKWSDITIRQTTK